MGEADRATQELRCFETPPSPTSLTWSWLPPWLEANCSLTRVGWHGGLFRDLVVVDGDSTFTGVIRRISPALTHRPSPVFSSSRSEPSCPTLFAFRASPDALATSALSLSNVTAENFVSLFRVSLTNQFPGHRPLPLSAPCPLRTHSSSDGGRGAPSP